MDYQPMGQEQNPVRTPEPAMSQDVNAGHANGIWYVVGAAVVVALGLWYFYGAQAPAEQSTGSQASTVEQTQMPAVTAGNTTADISADLGQIPDTSTALDADAAAAAAALSGL